MSSNKDEVPAEQLALTLLESFVSNQGGAWETMTAVALARSAALTMDEALLYLEPPRDMLVGEHPAQAVNFLFLGNNDRVPLTSVRNPGKSALNSYKLKITVPFSEGKYPERLPYGFLSFVIVLYEMEMAQSENAMPPGKPILRHIGVTFGERGAEGSSSFANEQSSWNAYPLQDAKLETLEKAGPTGFQIGQEKVERRLRYDMVYIPEGPFLMGAGGNDPNASIDETPQHEVYLASYYIDRTPVTNGDFRAFVSATGYQAEGIWEAFYEAGRDHYPVRGVSYNDAVAYANWAGKRLPTEAEWEKAMRGTDGRIYPWGNEFDHSLLAVGELYPVGTFPAGASPYGVLDGVGLVWEWTSSSNAKYPFNPQATGEAKVLRGGAWFNPRDHLRVTARWGESPQGFTKGTGFRCASDTLPGELPDAIHQRKEEVPPPPDYPEGVFF